MSSGYILIKMVKNMKIKDVDTEIMSNDEINSLIKKLYQSKAQDLGGGARSKISIQTLSSAEDAFNRNGKYYKWLNIPLYNNSPLSDNSKSLYFQKNTTNLVETIWWYGGENYDGLINWAFRYKDNQSKSGTQSFKKINIFIINYNE